MIKRLTLCGVLFSVALPALGHAVEIPTGSENQDEKVQRANVSYTLVSDYKDENFPYFRPSYSSTGLIGNQLHSRIVTQYPIEWVADDDLRVKRDDGKNSYDCYGSGKLVPVIYHSVNGQEIPTFLCRVLTEEERVKEKQDGNGEGGTGGSGPGNGGGRGEGSAGGSGSDANG